MGLREDTEASIGAISRFTELLARFKVAAQQGDRKAAEALRLEMWQALDDYLDAIARLSKPAG